VIVDLESVLSLQAASASEALRIARIEMLPIAVATAILLGAPGPKENRASAEPPRGVWELVRVDCDGSPAVAGANDSIRFRFTARTRELLFKGENAGTETVAFFKANGQWQMDVQPEFGGPILCILKADEDILTICQGRPGDDRPTDFGAPEGSGRTLWVLRRAKE
jgi:hypothetical protein